MFPHETKLTTEDRDGNEIEPTCVVCGATASQCTAGAVIESAVTRWNPDGSPAEVTSTRGSESTIHPTLGQPLGQPAAPAFGEYECQSAYADARGEAWDWKPVVHPSRVELHLSGEATTGEFTQAGWGKLVKDAGGTWSRSYGISTNTRVVTLPYPAARDLVVRLQATFSCKTAIFRGGTFTGNSTPILSGSVRSPALIEDLEAKYLEFLRSRPASAQRFAGLLVRPTERDPLVLAKRTVAKTEAEVARWGKALDELLDRVEATRAELRGARNYLDKATAHLRDLEQTHPKLRAQAQAQAQAQEPS